MALCKHIMGLSTDEMTTLQKGNTLYGSIYCVGYLRYIIKEYEQSYKKCTKVRKKIPES